MLCMLVTAAGGSLTKCYKVACSKASNEPGPLEEVSGKKIVPGELRKRLVRR